MKKQRHERATSSVEQRHSKKLDMKSDSSRVSKPVRQISSLVDKSEELASVIERNLRAIDNHRLEAERSKSIQDRIADAVTTFSGSMTFVYFHVVAFAVWIVVNIDWLPLPSFDPYPFGMLTTIVSLEAIFLATFVLVSQNRQALIAERRTELDLHINLLSEYEITRILKLTHEIAKKMGISDCENRELDELEKDVSPAVLLNELEVRATPKKKEDQSDQAS